MSAQRLVRLFYLFQFFFSFLLWVPVFYEYEKWVGLSDTQIYSIQSVYYLAFCLFEVPTGLAADFIGRLRCMRLGAALVTVGNLIPVFWPSFYGFVAHFVLVALSRSLISGAASAYLYDYLKQNNATELYRRAEGRARALSLGGKVILWASIGYLMKMQMTLPYTLSAAGTIVAVWLAWKFPEVKVSRGEESSARKFLRELRPALSALPRSPFLVLVMIQGVAIFVLSRVAQVDLFQPIMKLKGFEVGSFGLAMGLFSIFEAIGAAHPEWLRERFSRLRQVDLSLVFILTIILSACLSLVAVSGPILSVVWLCILSLVTGWAYPIQRQLMNDVIPDSRFRATYLSVESIVDRAGSAVTAMLMGGFVARGEVARFLQLGAVVSLGVMGFLIFVAGRLTSNIERKLCG